MEPYRGLGINQLFATRINKILILRNRLPLVPAGIPFMSTGGSCARMPGRREILSLAELAAGGAPSRRLAVVRKLYSPFAGMDKSSGPDFRLDTVEPSTSPVTPPKSQNLAGSRFPPLQLQ